MRREMTAAFISAIVLAAGCSMDMSAPYGEEITFSCRPDDFSASSRGNQSTDGIEDMITSVSLFIYHKDRLIFSDYREDISDGVKVTLENDWTYDIYALVNMGDMTGSMPCSLYSDMENDISWNIPSYGYINENGLPMVGKLKGFRAGKDSPVIRLKRLFAKVCVDISFAYSGASVRNVRIHNLNGTLKPFGTSRASEPSSIIADAGSGSGKYTFYIPENMQGEIGSASDAHEKNPDIDPDIQAKKDVLTYMEVEVELNGDGGYGGMVRYRSYLGNSCTRNFDICGNCLYNWKVTYLEDNLQYDDWKIDTGNMSSDIILPFLINPGWSDQEVIEL